MTLVKHTLNQKDFERLIEAPESLRDKAILRLLFVTGMRSGELTTTKIEDVDVKCKSIRIIDSKKKIPFSLPLDTTTCKLLTEYIAKDKEIRKYRRRELPSWLFPSTFKKGSHLTREAILRIVKLYAAKLDFNDYMEWNPRYFRRHLARRWVQKKGDLTALQQQLRHTHFSSTAVYIDGIRFNEEGRKDFDKVIGP